MVRIILNNDTIIDDVPSSILEQIYPEELNEDQEIPLLFVKPDNFVIFIENYNKIINNEELPLDIIIISLNVSIALQLYDLADQLESRIVNGLNNPYYLQDLKPYKDQVLKVLSELQSDISYEIVQKVKLFVIDYEINNVNIDRANIDLSIAVDGSSISNNNESNNSITYKFDIYKNGILDRTAYDRDPNKLRREKYYFRRVIGIESNGEVIILSPIERSKIARDGFKYLDMTRTMQKDTLYDINGNIIQDNIEIYPRSFSPNFNYAIHTNSKNPSKYWSKISDEISDKTYFITNVNTLSTIRVDVDVYNEYNYSFSPDEKYVALYNEVDLYIIDINTGEIINRIKSDGDIFFDKILISTSLIFIYIEHTNKILYLDLTDNNIDNTKQFPFDYDYRRYFNDTDFEIGIDNSIGINIDRKNDKRFLVYKYLPTSNMTLVDAVDKLLD